MATKRVIQAPTINNSGQITGSSGKTYITTVPAKVSNFVPGTATSSSGGPTDDGGSFVDYNPTTDIKGNIIGGSSGRVNYDNTGRVVNTSVKPAVPTGGADKSVALMSAGKSGVTNNLAGGKTDSLPGVTKYAGNNQTYGNNRAGIDLVNRQSELNNLSEAEKAQRLAGAYNPVPTVATTQNPVVKKTLPKEEPPVKPDIQAMDLPTIQENIDRLTYKVNSGKSLTEDEYVTFNQLRRQATDMMKPQSLTGGLDNLMQQQQSEITTTQQTLEEQNAKDLEAFTKSQEAYKTSQIAMINQEENLSRQRMAAIFGATGQDSSTDTISTFGQMEQNYSLQKQAKIEEVQAKIDLFGSQQRKDSAETIQKMKDRLYSTQLKAAEFDVANLQEINKYNQEQSKSTLEKLDNLKAMSDSILASSTPLTEEQKQQAAVIGQFLVDPDGGLNQALLESYKKTNPNLIPYALSMAVGERNKIQENKLAMQGLDADIKKAQLNKLLNPDVDYKVVANDDGTYTRTGSDGSVAIVDPKSGASNAQVSDPNVQSSIAQYSQQQRGRATLQCGELVNDYIKKETGTKGSLGNSFADKVAGIEKIGRSASPVVGGVFAFDIKTSQGNTGHTGIVTGVNADGSINVLEANRKENSANGGVPAQGTYSADQVRNMVFSQAPSGKQLSSVAKEAIKSGQINGTPTVQSGIIKELADSGEFDKGLGNSTFYTSKPAVKDEIANFAEGYAKRQQAKEIFNKLKADGTLGGATGWFDNLANKGKRFAGEGSSDVNNLNQILAESLSKYMNKISGATVSETEVERLREQIPNLGMGDKQFTDAFEQYDASMQRGLDNTLTKYGFNSYDDIKQKIYGNKSEQTQPTSGTLSGGTNRLKK